MILTREDKELLLETAESAAHYYSTFLLHDDWEVGLSQEQINESNERLERFYKAIEVSKRILGSALVKK